MAESEVQFKVYYRSEIRRFSLRDGQSLSYTCLAQRIQAAFDIPPTVQLRLRWLDSDGDRISFGSSSELTDAVLHLTAARRDTAAAAAAVRIYATGIEEEAATPGFNQSQITHPGVFCDGCDTALTGYRFKCLSCPNYDLCLACLNRDVHSHHQMLLIRRPGDGGGWGGWGGGWGGSWGGHCRGGMRRCPRQQHQQQGEPATCHQRPTSDDAATATATETAEAAAATEQQLIEHVTSAVNALLEPLGIDASIQVVHDAASADANVRAAAAEQPTQQELASSASLNGSESTLAGDYEFVGGKEASPSSTPPPPPPPPPAKEPKIARALEHMTAMGFNDEGGWLTRLLVAKDGDICAVLDAIRPIGGGGSK